MKMRNATAAVAIGAAALLLASCGSSGNVGSSNDVEQNTGPNATITYWTWFPPQATLNAAITAFEQEHPNITVELRTFEAADYQKQLPLALSGGEAIDVVGVQVSAMTNSVKDYLHPVDHWADGWGDNINPTMIKQTQAVAGDDVLYMLPMGSIGSPLMYYNAAMLAELDISVPTTSAEWKVAVDQISAAKPEVTPVVFSGEPYWQEEMLFGIAEQNAPGLSDDIIGGEGAWDQQGLVNGLHAYKSIFDNGIVSTDVLSLLGSRPSELFSSGKAAFYIDGSWQNSLLSANYRQSSGIALKDVGVTGLPVINGGTPAVRALAEGGLAIPSASKNVEAASTFIKWMVGAGGADVWASDLILVPSLTGYTVSDSVLESVAAQEGFKTASALISSPSSRRDSQQDFLNQVEGNTVLDVLRGTITPEQAAAKLQSEWTSGRYPHGSGK